MSTLTKHPYIVSTPGTCGGRPRIDGHRIRVQDVAIMYEHEGRTPDEICNAFPTLNLAKVHAALAYYYDHRDEIEKEIDDERRAYDEYKRQHPEASR